MSTRERIKGAAGGAAAVAAVAAAVAVAPPAQAQAAPVGCRNGAGDVAALVNAVRAGGTVTLTPSCTYRLTKRYGTTSALPTITKDTTIQGGRARIDWAGPERIDSVLDVDGNVSLQVHNLTITSGGVQVPTVIRGRNGASVSVNNSIVAKDSHIGSLPGGTATTDVPAVDDLAAGAGASATGAPAGRGAQGHDPAPNAAAQGTATQDAAAAKAGTATQDAATAKGGAPSAVDKGSGAQSAGYGVHVFRGTDGSPGVRGNACAGGNLLSAGEGGTGILLPAGVVLNHAGEGTSVSVMSAGVLPRRVNRGGAACDVRGGPVVTITTDAATAARTFCC